jgi:hypothetical protein
MHTAMDVLVVFAGYLESNPAFQFAHGHGGVGFTFVLSTFDRVRECGARQVPRR